MVNGRFSVPSLYQTHIQYHATANLARVRPRVRLNVRVRVIGLVDKVGECMVLDVWYKSRIPK